MFQFLQIFVSKYFKKNFILFGSLILLLDYILVCRSKMFAVILFEYAKKDYEFKIRLKKVGRKNFKSQAMHFLCCIFLQFKCISLEKI